MQGKKAGASDKTLIYLALIIVGAVVFVKYGDNWFGDQPQQVTAGIGSDVPPVDTAACNPESCAISNALTFAGVDQYTESTTYLGTNRIKAGNNEWKTTLTAAPRCTELMYWLDNTSLFCERDDSTAVCGPQLVQAKCIINSTGSLSGYDTDGKAALAIASHNLTIGSGGSGHFELYWTPEDKKSTMPFGAFFCAEANATTIEYVKPSGFSQISSAPSTVTVNGKTYPLSKKITYSPSATGQTYWCYYVPAGFDNTFGEPSDASQRTMAWTVKALSGQNPAAVEYVTVTKYPLNLRIETDGQLKLEAEYDEATTKSVATPAALTIYLA
jgi:hypothetical protein